MHVRVSFAPFAMALIISRSFIELIRQRETDYRSPPWSRRIVECGRVPRRGLSSSRRRKFVSVFPSLGGCEDGRSRWTSARATERLVLGTTDCSVGSLCAKSRIAINERHTLHTGRRGVLARRGAGTEGEAEGWLKVGRGIQRG